MKPTPDQLEQLRAANPKGSPRIDYREMLLEVRAKAEGDVQVADAIPVSISSERAVLRYDYWEDSLYYEVLAHDGDSVDLSYSRDGLPFVASHRAWDADSQHGIVENVRVEDAVLRGDIRMSKAARSQEIKQDLVDGIRKKVSVGYIIGTEYEQTKADKDGIPTRRYTAWMPLEVSTVPVPADYDVGIGRTKSAAGQAALARFLQLHPNSSGQRNSSHLPPLKGKAGTMPDDNNGNAPAGGAPNVQVNDRGNANEDAANRVRNIMQLAAQHGCTDKLEGWLRSGTSEFDIRGEINNILADRIKKPIETSRGIELSDKEARRFSYARALLADGSLAREIGAGTVDIGFEREIIEEARKRTPMATGQGIFIPFVSTRAGAQRESREFEQRLERLERAIDSATNTTGGPFKFTQPGDFIELLRNKTSVMRAGATVLSGLAGPVTFPKQTAAGGNATWRGENPGSDMTRGDLTTSTVTLAFKTLQAATAVSRQAIFSAASGNFDLEQIVRSDLAAVIALGIDLGGLNGLGASNQPLGILQDTLVGTAPALGANGGSIAWGNIVDLETAVGDANADTNRMAYITNTKQRGQAKKVAVLGNTAAGVPIWSGIPGDMDGIVNGYRAIASNQVPRNLTKGTGTTICSAWVFGTFEFLMIGMFGAGFEVLVDPYTLKLQNLVDLTAWTFADVGNRYPVGFSTLKDAL